MNDIKWELTGNDPNDLKAVIGGDMLRVEKLDKRVWWFAVYVEHDTMMSGVEFEHQTTKRKAIKAAEVAYNLFKSGRYENT